MPVERGRDTNGCFFRYGKSGKKYYYIAGNERSRNIAKNKAKKQGVAIAISKSRKSSGRK